MKKYYHAYDERYKTIHEKGYSWSSDKPTPKVLEVLEKYHIDKKSKILEIGCGEGRDSVVLLKEGYNLLATDASKEAIQYCQNKYPEYKNSFQLLDCLNNNNEEKYDFIFAVAVLHMLVLDEDRNAFYQFIYSHLADKGIALVFSMGNGEHEMMSDINEAFELKERNHESGKIQVAATSCRMVSFKTFRKEIADCHLKILEDGIAESFPDFDKLMFAVLKK